MKKTLCRLLMLGLFTAANVQAEGDHNGGDEFRNTAVEYDRQAAKYREKGHPPVAKIYDRMAEIKRHAAELADQGKWDDIDWSEYHRLEHRLEKLKQNKH